ncbi:MAG: hypothetical protein WCK77_13425 [Verrucomicrobiota bacterium]
MVFKRIFGEHPEILRDFLNGVLPFEGKAEGLLQAAAGMKAAGVAAEIITGATGLPLERIAQL